MIVVTGYGSLWYQSGGGTGGSGGPPSGSAGGDLTGTYPNPTISGTANVEAIIRANSLDQLAAPASSVSWNSQRLTTLADATLPTDAANARVSYAPWQRDVNTWTRTGNQTFTLAVDATSYLKAGLYVAWQESSVTKYGCIQTVAFAAGTTTVTLITTTDYVMAASPDANTQKYSYGRPYDAPHSFAYTPVNTGFSANPVYVACWWVDQGIFNTFIFTFATGTSNGTGYTITGMPAVATGRGGFAVGLGVDNGANVQAHATVSGTTITFSKSPSGAGWTASGGKGITLNIFWPMSGA